MTRRILTWVLALTAALLVAAVVPLALKATQHDQQSYVSAAEADAHSLATIADGTKLLDNRHEPRMELAMKSYAYQGDWVAVVDTQGHVILDYGPASSGGWHRLVATAYTQGDTATAVTKSLVMVAEPIWSDVYHSDNPVGLIVLERPTTALTDTTDSLWLYVGVLAAVAMLAAAVIAITFARWVSKPLVTMDGAARRLADGDLTVRAGTGSGPPEVRRMAASFNMMAGRLETLVHGHRAMLADVSHQLRTPLAALRLRIDLLAVDAGEAAQGELAGAQEEIVRLSRLVDGLLAAARAESVTEQRVVINVLPTVAERVAAWQPVADGSGVKLLLDPAACRGQGQDPDLRVALGVGHLEQVLDNLLANAIEALGDGGQVTVTVSGTETVTKVVVADDGPGMSEEERSRAFLRFFTASQNGTGLGLAIVHRLVTSNGGTARLSDTPGGGLTVTLEFPTATGHDGIRAEGPGQPA